MTCPTHCSQRRQPTRCTTRCCSLDKAKRLQQRVHLLRDALAGVVLGDEADGEEEHGEAPIRDLCRLAPPHQLCALVLLPRLPLAPLLREGVQLGRLRSVPDAGGDARSGGARERGRTAPAPPAPSHSYRRRAPRAAAQGPPSCARSRRAAVLRLPASADARAARRAGPPPTRQSGQGGREALLVAPARSEHRRSVRDMAKRKEKYFRRNPNKASRPHHQHGTTTGDDGDDLWCPACIQASSFDSQWWPVQVASTFLWLR